MDWDTFSTWGHKAADWAADYHKGLRDRPVRPALEPGKVRAAIPDSPPEKPEGMEAIFKDFEDIIVPGMTHWQHPRFFAYFPANAAPISVVAEYLVSSIAAQCMLWQTSPAATELEGKVLDWLRQGLGLPEGFSGVIQDSASSATLAAVLTMRERALNWQGNKQGLAGNGRLRVYASAEVHSSIDRAIWISGIGEENLVRIPTLGPNRGLDVEALQAAIELDRSEGFIPAGFIGNVGGTSAGATDDLQAAIAVAKDEGLFTHVDAAWAGSAMICPEFRHYWEGVEQADSVVFNPHKWLGAQFDCSAHFVADPESLVKTLAIQPEYLKTQGADGIINYSEWSIPLGRRFRALKLWFLLRGHGLEGLRTMIRNHVAWAEKVHDAVAAMPEMEIVTPPMLSLFTFRLAPDALGGNAAALDALNMRLIEAVNNDGRIYLTQTKIDGKFVIRFSAGTWTMEEQDADTAIAVIAEIAGSLRDQDQEAGAAS
ncbi:MAG: pyridoxal phosphate-dependent decarboxylase family protein [Alphaproteobacteria bacterium]